MLKGLNKLIEEKKNKSNKIKIKNEVVKVFNDNKINFEDKINGEYKYDLNDINKLNEISKIKFHNKNICSLNFDNKGYKMISSCYEGKVGLFDFYTMKSDFQPYRFIEPISNQPITINKFNYNAEKILISGGNNRPILYSKEGRKLFEFCKGDMYISDSKNTKGHSKLITDCVWHNYRNNWISTCSLDGTIRIWDINMEKIGIEELLQNKSVFKFYNNNKNIGFNKFWYLEEYSIYLTGCTDGSFHIFSKDNNFCRPIESISLDNEEEIYSIKLFRNTYNFISRTNEGNIYLFDRRKLNTYVNKWTNFYNYSEQSEIELINEDKTLIIGNSYQPDTNIKPKLIYFNLKNSTIEKEIEIGKKNITQIKYIKNLNQLFVGVDNEINIFYNKDTSSNGILNAMNKKQNKKKVDEFEYERPIYVPNALPMFRPEINYKLYRFDKVRQDDVKTHKPIEPLNGPGYKGLISGPRTIAQSIMSVTHQINNHDQDIQKLLLKTKAAKYADRNYDNAYALTQPKRIFSKAKNLTKEQELMNKHKKCKHCGNKLCLCKRETGLF